MNLLRLVEILLLLALPACVSNAYSTCERDYSKPPLFDAIGATTQDGAKIFSVKKKSWHPPHCVKVWTTKYKGRIYRVTQLPRCEHVETLITYSSSGETLARAKKRFGGIAVCTGSFHHPQSYCLADFVQKDGEIISSARTGRAIVTINHDGILGISDDYCSIKGQSGISALALGQRLIPLMRDGFSLSFMNRITERMAIGLNDNFIFLVQSKTSIWRLAGFMKRKLPCKTAVNSDGGHVVRGRAPVHIVFRWKTNARTP
ncbi:MAG: hypothetical protein ABFD83_06685 [Armatimonadota bacterium]